jgi:hypothetical protein
MMVQQDCVRRMIIYRVFIKRRSSLERLTTNKVLLHLNSVWKQIIAASWHCRQDQHILQTQ